MLRTLRDIFDSFTAIAESQSPQQLSHVLQLATAVLLVDVMRADADMGDTERAAVLASLGSKFALADDELARLLELAEDTAKTSHDYHRFTSSMNAHFTQAQKIQVVEYMWQVAYADAHLDAHENHLIGKIAGLLHVTHGEYIGAKMRAKEAAGLV
ncbi:MAG: TerB family tellurite resistance protein [Polaromonas sp.]|uniref:tellurite resistance TerB family protein n=1 Tax=Polaromonas sp. TaxID=1869339 RepID=UPI00272FDD5B|nr:TerB family tellurite resistance protein [Polaromonas sp.]MDP1742597.1 TerB family tellurite resistance protein [Polaromonas sp.]MDP1955635.1 TerB family tellurite resistance protein [Polaromonas sp.]MDP3356067.1 TerB family tellurite resistance protein [Polaromonas sp.]MDP3752473.1 TerB family tellurite resistance protein [Polaromonas sp.]